MHHLASKSFLLFILPLLSYLTVALILSPHISHAAGNTYHVSKSGSDSNSCSDAQSASSPKLTIGAGISCMNGGDTLIIHAGTYRENISYISGNMPPSGISGAPTILQKYGSDPAGSVIIAPTNTSQNTVVDFYDGNNSSLPQYITFDGITLDGNDGVAPSPPNGSQPINAFCWRMESGIGFVFQNGEIRNCTIGVFPGNSSIIRNSHIHHHGIDTQFNHCFYGSGNSSIIENNEIDHCANYGIQY